MEPVQIGVIGCGNISERYFDHLKKLEGVEVRACADVIRDRAAAAADRFDIPRAGGVNDLLSDSKIELVVNLTIPGAHYEVALQCIEAGKHVYNEKPLALNRREGKRILEEAERNRLLVGCAPDTFLGGGIQTCRKLIDDGIIGEPVAVDAFMMCHGHEAWHPDPEFYYKLGGGPMLDMGPYYLTALVNLIGPIRRIAGSARVTFPERTITSEPKRGTKILVETPTHIAGTMEFAQGAVGSMIMSFDTWAHELPFIEIHGSEGSLSTPDPNTFTGPVRVFRPEWEEWREQPLTHSDAFGRGLGVLDMARAIRTGRAHRANGKLAYHVLDAMHAFLESSEEGRHIELSSECERPKALPAGLADGVVD